MQWNVRAVIMAIIYVVFFTDTLYATEDFLEDSVWGQASSDEERNTLPICQNRTQLLDWLPPEQERVYLLFCWRWTCVSLGTSILYAVCVCMYHGILWWLSARQSEDISLHEPDSPRYRPNGTPIWAHWVGEYNHPMLEAQFLDAETWERHPDFMDRMVEWSPTNRLGFSKDGVVYATYVN